MSCETFVVAPMPGEYVFSFIFRINMVLAPCKMPNVINKNGRWNSSITLPFQYQDIFLKMGDSQVYKLLLDSGVFSHRKDVLKSPVGYTETMSAVLQGKTVHNISFAKLSYCPKCIAEFISIYGFAYFKADWGLGYNCRVHKKPFNIIETNNRKDSLQAIEQVMTGRRSRFCKSLRDFPYYRDFESENNSKQHGIETQLPHLASCLESKLKAWLLTDGHTFPKILIMTVRSANHDSLVRNMESHVFRDYVFKKAYAALHRSDYSRFNNFWSRYAEIHKFYCGVIEKQGLVGAVAKLRGGNCSKCCDRHCPANLLIAPSCRSLGFNFRGYKCPGEQMKSDYYFIKHTKRVGACCE